MENVGMRAGEALACQLRSSRHPPFFEMLPLDDGMVYASCAPTTPAAWLERSWERLVIAPDDLIQRSLPFGHDLPNIAGVYFLIRDGAIVYVGQSKEMASRVVAHRRDGKIFQRTSCIYGLADGMLRDVEALYIDAIRPVENAHYRMHPSCLAKAYKRLRQMIPLRSEWD